jgi:hypothetical protein
MSLLSFYHRLATLQGETGPSITSYVFDGNTTSYFADEASTPTMLDGVVNQTFVIRIKITGSDVQQGILGCNNRANSLKMEIDANDNRSDGAVVDTGSSTFTNGNISMDGQWRNVFFYYDGTNIGFYEDNTLIKNNNDPDFTARTAGRALAIGASAIGGGLPGRLVGEISDVQFYNKRLSVGEIAALNIDLTDTASGLIANFAGQKTSTTWTSELGGYVLTNQGGVTTA